MYNSEKKVTIEWMNNGNESLNKVSNPISDGYTNYDKISIMVSKILQEEIPQLKNNQLLYDLVLYSIIEKMNTVQTVGNVLSYIKECHARGVHDVSITNGEVLIKCLV